jgi:signal transduction histidine kinase
MRPLLKQFNSWFEPTLLLATLLALLIYTVGLFLALPYWGFEWGSPLYQNVGWLAQANPLQLGDELLQLGSIRMADLSEDAYLRIPPTLWSAETLPLTVLRNGQTLSINYAVPGFTWAEFLRRLSSPWWLAWLFGVFGALNYLSVRPKDERWRLLTLFYCLIAVILVTGTNVGRQRLWEAPFVLRAATWVSLPIFWHLHWIFPYRLGLGPARRAIGVALYLGAAAMMIVESLGLIPQWGLLYSSLAAFLGIVVPQLIRLVLPSPFRRARLLWLLLLAGGLPVILLIVLTLAGLGAASATLSLLGLPLLPIIYFYIAYQRQLGGLELRANRLIAVYLFAFFLAVLSLPIAYWHPGGAGADEVPTLVILGCVLAAGVGAALGFPSFQKFVERRFLGQRPLPRHRLGHFNSRIAASLDQAMLAKVLADEVLSDLMIRQSALVTISAEGGVQSVYTRKVSEAELPTPADIRALEAEAGRYRLHSDDEPAPCTWARVVLRLAVAEKLLGLWLLGRRDPDDDYSQPEIDYLQTLAGQSALALKNLEQTEQLRALYQFNIDQREAERSRLARDLHDVTLNQLAVLRNSAPPEALSPQFVEAYERIVGSLREAISALRPPLLDYGLYFSLKALASDHEEREDPTPEFLFDLPSSAERYDSKVEEYTYRILRQAYDNALVHAGARQLRLSGCLGSGCIDVVLEDDGCGFSVPEALNPGTYSTRRRFGLRNMSERAALIGANLYIDAAPGRGTHIRLFWHAPDPVPPPVV